MATAHGLTLSRAPLYNIDVGWEDILEVINQLIFQIPKLSCKQVMRTDKFISWGRYFGRRP